MPVHPLATDLLTDGQRRHLIASLQQVAASLVEIESLARSNGAPATWPLAKTTYDLPDAFGAAIEPHLTQARAQVADAGPPPPTVSWRSSSDLPNESLGQYTRSRPNSRRPHSSVLRRR